MAPHHNITAQNIMNSTQFIYTSFSRLRRVKKLIYSHYMPKGLSQFMVGIRYHIALFKFLFSNTTEEIWWWYYNAQVNLTSWLGFCLPFKVRALAAANRQRASKRFSDETESCPRQLCRGSEFNTWKNVSKPGVGITHYLTITTAAHYMIIGIYLTLLSQKKKYRSSVNIYWQLVSWKTVM